MRKYAPLQDLQENWLHLMDPISLTEAEALRIVDLWDTDDKEELALLYTYITFQRIIRNRKRDHISDYFLNKAKQIQPIRKTEEVESFIIWLESLQLSEYISGELVPRETDHMSIKQNKMAQLLEEIKTFKDLIPNGDDRTPLSDEDSLLFQELTKLQNSVIDLHEVLLELQKEGQKNISSQSLSNVQSFFKEIMKSLDEIQLLTPNWINDIMRPSPLKELDNMIGIKQVKEYIRNYYLFLKYQQDRKKLGLSMKDEPGLHMIITGNPGTGKTTIARLLAKLYADLSLLKSDEIVEVNRSHLVGSYVGQSEENTMSYIKQAEEKILFIDEAYSLKREGQTGNDYGQAVIDTLVSAMTSKEHQGKFGVILAGYPEEMRQFLWSNPGLRSRFPEQNHIELSDYKMEELIIISEQMALENDYFFTETALNVLEEAIDQRRVDQSFGNARTVKDVILSVIFHKGANRDQEKLKNSIMDHMRITEDDIRFVLENNRNEKDPEVNLQSLVGLDHIKAEVEKISSFVNMQQRRKEKGFPKVPIQLHAVFSGNPGTGKTTVAHLYAQILKNCGLLKRGHMVVVSRSDLVAGYVGQTAIKTKRKIREALGGVLFIDEAYSLMQGSQQDFGKEAIDTLVDEMTKHEENLVVILAGYVNEMNYLLESNPGLFSRFKKYFHFPNYTPAEMIQMGNQIANSYKYQVSKEAINQLEENLNSEKINGNGRFIRNIIEEAIQFQALRQERDDSHADWDILNKDDILNAWKMVKEREGNGRE
ncbi:AAA family ATPase [Bacillaceae bacterium S4-13-58]